MQQIFKEQTCGTFRKKEENEKAIDLKVIEGNGCAKESKGRIKTKIE